MAAGYKMAADVIELMALASADILLLIDLKYSFNEKNS